MRCPRCRRPLHESRISGQGGIYRSVLIPVLRCAGCQLVAADMSAIAQLRGVEGVRLRETPLCREVKPLRQTCGACPASLAQLTLSWDERWAEVEECGACGLFYLDPGELEGVAEMMIEAAGVIADSDLERSE